MQLLVESLEYIRDFMETGGQILWAILAVSIVLWTLIIERYWYLRLVHPRYLRQVVEAWKRREEMHSWHAHQIRRMLISDINMRLNRSLLVIKTLIALCPLLGLLGTVTGMIQVFDVMAVTGTGNARAMASGVSMATIPTMAGMVAALSGFYFSARLQTHAATEGQKAADLLRDYHGEQA
ncbi:MAG TPA: MotA/TolQ/ExbB proton channel family protein [Thiotrichales bacterium]|nr:MotA/TolQ/ExbB proton channel family protein [Thiotrichales bacterium]